MSCWIRVVVVFVQGRDPGEKGGVGCGASVLSNIIDILIQKIDGI